MLRASLYRRRLTRRVKRERKMEEQGKMTETECKNTKGKQENALRDSAGSSSSSVLRDRL